MFNFGKKYNNVHFSNINNNNYDYRLYKINVMDSQLTYGLNKIVNILRFNPKSDEYKYYKAFIKSILSTINEEDIVPYIDGLSKDETKLLLLNKVLGEKNG